MLKQRSQMRTTCNYDACAHSGDSPYHDGAYTIGYVPAIRIPCERVHPQTADNDIAVYVLAIINERTVRLIAQKAKHEDSGNGNLVGKAKMEPPNSKMWQRPDDGVKCNANGCDRNDEWFEAETMLWVF